jgi:2-methylcitrate dehydratase
VDGTTETIVRFASQIAADSLSASTLLETRRRLVDSLACLVGGVDAPPVRVARALADEVTSTTAASVAGSRRSSSPELAAFANTVAVRYLDYNDTYFSPMGGGGHPSDLIPTALAVGEATGASGRDVLAAIVVAYEVWGRLAGTVRIRERGWDQGLFTVVASAVCAGRLLGLTPEQLGEAISLAVIPHVPTRRTRAGALSMWKGCATAGAARNGIFAAKLAALGMTGPPDPFEGPEGIWDQVTGPFALALDVPAPGSFVVERSLLKSRPAEYNAQGPLDLVIGMRDEVKPDQVDRIDVETYWLCWSEIGHEPAKWDPRNRETADHSLPYLMAVGLVDGHVGLGSFSESRLADPALRPLMRAIHVTESEDLTQAFPGEIGCRIAVRLKDGRRVERETRLPRGHADNPLSSGDIDAKFQELTEFQPGNAAVAEALRETGWRADTLTDIGSLTELVAQLEPSTQQPNTVRPDTVDGQYV